MTIAEPSAAASPRTRIGWIDLVRGIALVAMATYHFSWDLESFGYLDPGTASTGVLKWYARSIASSFLMLVGVSLFLAHGKGIRWRSFAKRMAIVAASAAAITGVTWFATPDGFIFFGILHQIALASVLGLAFLRFPPIAVLLVAAAWYLVPVWAKSEMFSQPWLLWLGLSPSLPRSNDFVPVFPWFSAVLTGIAITHVAVRARLTGVLAGNPPPVNALTRGLRFLGRHSLITYLVHQPVLIACVYLFSLAFPPVPLAGEQAFFDSCHRSCLAANTNEQCTAFCGCAITRLTEAGLFDIVMSGEITQQSDPRVDAVSRQCSFEAGIGGN